ncbi:MAG: hypothetical protein HY753_08945 [Nitrospirae bacterium]|nr:hypothetical protein [Nitrospirota bacterium]
MVAFKYIGNDILLFNDDSGKEIVFPLLIIITASFFALILICQDSCVNLIEIIFFAFLVILLVSVASRSIIIEINRKEGIIKKTHRILLFSKSRTFSLHDFDTIQVIGKEVSGIEGYSYAIYSVIMQGKNLSVELMSANDENEAESSREEIDKFLQSLNKISS